MEKILLRESASVENVTRAMDNHAMVIINYHSDGKDNNTGSRVIEPIAYGLTKAGNPVIRAFQPFGDTTSITPGWKFFRLDRISYWEETNRKFELPDPKYGEINTSGDNTMAVVIKNFDSTNKTVAPSAVNAGPKTKQKIYAQTSGDKQVQLGAKNIKNMESPIYIDLDNNKKVDNGFNMYTKNTQQTKGPRQPDQSYNGSNISGSVENGDISADELQHARQQVYGNSNADRSDILNNDDLWTQYSHDYTDDEISQADFDKAVMNRQSWQNKNLSTSRRKFERENAWQNSADNRFLNHKDSGNRFLYNMEHENDEEEI